MKDLIYNQHDLTIPYGLRSSAATGCGWVAVHNALCVLGCRTDTDQLIRYLEAQLPLLHGTFGTSFWGPALCMKKMGFSVKQVVKRSEFDREAKAAPACILFYRWRSGIKLGAHFVALHHTDTGFVGYNTFKNSTGPDIYGESLDTFLKNRKYCGCVLFPIGRKAT